MFASWDMRFPPSKKYSYVKFPAVQEGLSFFCGMFSSNVSWKSWIKVTES
jgi:hypothetical protein